MEAEFRKIAEGHAQVKSIEMIKGQELLDQGMGLFHAVGRCALSEPRCMIAKFVGDEDNADRVDLAIVGKGITYDTGGLNIKMALMEAMHADKQGASSVMGCLQACIELKIKKNITFVCAFAENAIGPDAYKPGDILTA